MNRQNALYSLAAGLALFAGVSSTNLEARADERPVLSIRPVPAQKPTSMKVTLSNLTVGKNYQLLSRLNLQEGDNVGHDWITNATFKAPAVSVTFTYPDIGYGTPAMFYKARKLD